MGARQVICIPCQLLCACLHMCSLQERKVIGEKKVNKNFQYDTPGDIVITYISEVIYTIFEPEVCALSTYHVCD